MNTTLSILAVLAVMGTVYALAKRDWAGGAALGVGAVLLALLAIMRGEDQRRDY
jgi:hypothetical protein